MASCPCCVFLSVHNREDIYYYWFVYLAGRAVYSGQFVCVCVAFTEYERPPMTKSPIWSRLKLKQDAQVHLLYAFQFIYFPMQEGDWRRQPLISFSLKDSKRKKQLQGSSVKYGSCAVVSVEKSASAMLSPTPWLQGGRVRRDHQFGDLRHCACRCHGHLCHCMLRQQPPAQGKATGVEASEMLCSSEVANYVCQFVILWPQCTYVSFSGRSTTKAYVNVLMSTTQPSSCRRCWASKCRGL
nr:uncharacterized protein LOC109757865 isoform X3 [Aegilops tauschii subsp. strangulata]